MYRIFCVEDDETIGKMIKRHLEKWEYDVHVAKKSQSGYDGVCCF